MNVLLLALLAIANGISSNNSSEVITGNLTSARNSILVRNFSKNTTSTYLNSTSTGNSDQNSTIVDVVHYERNFTGFSMLANQFMQESDNESKLRLHFSFSNYTANLCNYTNEYLQTLLGDWTMIKYYARDKPNHVVREFSNCVTIRLAPSKGTCKCHGMDLPVFYAVFTREYPKTKYIKDVAFAFITHFKEAIKLGNKRCQCKRIIAVGRILSDNYILLYDSYNNQYLNNSRFIVIARNGSAMWELENLEETTLELVNRKQTVLCESVIFYTALKADNSMNKSKLKRQKLKLGFGLSSLSFFDYLNTIPRKEFLEIAFSSSVPL